MRLTFQARQTISHSPVTLRNPRKENCLNPLRYTQVPIGDDVGYEFHSKENG